MGALVALTDRTITATKSSTSSIAMPITILLVFCTPIDFPQHVIRNPKTVVHMSGIISPCAGNGGATDGSNGAGSDTPAGPCISVLKVAGATPIRAGGIFA
jgi:hypothetical protein